MGTTGRHSTRRRRRINLRTQLMILMTLTSASALIVGFGSLYYVEARQQHSGLERYLTNLVTTAVASLETLEAGNGEFKDVAGRLIRVLAEQDTRIPSDLVPRMIAVCVYDQDRIPLAWHPPSKAPPRFPSSYRSREFVRHGHTLETFVDIGRPSLPGISTEERPMLGALYLQADLKIIEFRRKQALGMMIVLPMIAFLLSWLLSSRLENFISRPITQLAQTTLQITEVKDYSPRLNHHRSDEIGDLIDGFNGMMAEIEHRDVALHQAHDQLEQRVLERTRELRQEIGDRRRAEKDLAQQLTRISLLNQITHAIANHQDVESILSVVLGELTKQLPADLGSVLLADETGREFRVASCQERELETAFLVWKMDRWSVPLKGSPWEDPAAGPVFVHGELDKADSPVFRKPIELGMQSAAALPLRYEHTLLGILLVARRSAQGFTEGECAFLCSLSEHVALAGHQAQIYSELQKAYDELRQTQQAVMRHERLRALGQMASGVAHDINNALSPVGGFAEVLLSNERSLSENGRKYLGYIKTASDDIAHIVSRLREFYRSREEQQPVLPVDLNKLVTEVLELTRPRWRDLAQSRGISIEARLDLIPDTPPALGVEAELREALTNLIFNAVDALPKGGTLTLRTRGLRRAPAGESKGPLTHVVVEVEDTGLGMDEDTRKRCLEPFFSTKGQRGTGLGLAMVYGTVQRHEGSIEIESEVGHGTLFRLVFPRRELPGAPATPTSPKQDPLPKLRILFVDDEPLLRELMRELLETEGHHVTTADGGPAGLDAFERMHAKGQAPDVVITDLGMPYLDGRELATRLKTISPNTPVIMMTGWGKMMREDDEIRAPVDALVSKPPQMAELTAALRQVIRQSGA